MQMSLTTGFSRRRQSPEPSLRSRAESHFEEGDPPGLPNRTGVPEGLGIEYSRREEPGESFLILMISRI